MVDRTLTRENPKVISRFTAVLVCLLLLMVFVATAAASGGNRQTFPIHWKLKAAKLSGVVRSDAMPIPFSTVTLYKAGKHSWDAVVLGTTRSDGAGNFTIFYKRPADSDSILYLIADGKPELSKWYGFRFWGSPVRLGAVLDPASDTGDVVINERTTVGAAYAMAQFIIGRSIGGKNPGLGNAAMTAQNLVDISTGEVGEVLASSPNGSETSTMREFNSLANLLATCVHDENPDSCSSLFSLAKPPRGFKPANTLQAIVNIAHTPWQNIPELFALSQDSNLYEPALESSMVPDAWTLAIRYTGNSGLLDGPGNIAFDKHGNAWVNNNYQRTSGSDYGCGGDHIFKFTPIGNDAPGSPYGGSDGNNGGLYGSGFGITLDPFGDVWASNFGFTGSDCAISGTDRALLSSSVSQFDPDGYAISPSRPPVPYGGWRSAQANIYQPQGTVSDQWGNIWLANCGNASVTKLPGGNIDEAMNFNDLGLDKPFGIAIGPKGNAWVASNGNNSVIELGQDGSPIGSLITGGDINLPMGIAVDRLGNVWIANSGAIRTPCGGDLAEDMLPAEVANTESPPAKASVMLRRPDGKLETFKGGGIFVPWGISVDGDDNVWVANFAGPKSGLIGITELCGAKPWNCPPGHKTGDPISPDTGYTSDGLTRVTAVSIDPSGNVWAANNWLKDALENLDNPGGHELVVFVGLAAPVKTPVIGPPRKP